MNVLVFLQPGTNSRSQFSDMARGFKQAGHNVIIWELEPMWQAYARAVQAPPVPGSGTAGGEAVRTRLTAEFGQVVKRFIEANDVRFSMAMWANALTSMSPLLHEGKPCSIFDMLNIGGIKHTHMCMWLDAPHWAHEGQVPAMLKTPGGQLLRSEHVCHFINNPGTGLDMERVFGMRNVLPRSYGIDPEVFKPYPGEQRAYDLVYACGPGDPLPTPMMLEEIEKDEPDLLAIRKDNAERLIPTLEPLVNKFPENLRPAAKELLRLLIQSQIEDRNTPMVTRLESIIAGASDAVKTAGTLTMKDPQAFVEVTHKVRSIETFERAFYFSYLSRHFKCYGFGSGDFTGWGCRAERAGGGEGFIPYEDQARMYSRGKVGLNVMRWQDDVGLNVKPYEITASGAALFAARRTHLDELFTLDGDAPEAVVFTSPADAREKLQGLLKDEGRLAAIAEAGRRRTLRDHTWARVAESLLQRACG